MFELLPEASREGPAVGDKLPVNGVEQFLDLLLVLIVEFGEPPFSLKLHEHSAELPDQSSSEAHALESIRVASVKFRDVDDILVIISAVDEFLDDFVLKVEEPPVHSALDLPGQLRGLGLGLFARHTLLFFPLNSPALVFLVDDCFVVFHADLVHRPYHSVDQFGVAVVVLGKSDRLVDQPGEEVLFDVFFPLVQKHAHVVEDLERRG